MRILISNDDGIFAPGIKALAETLGKEHEVYIVAPDRERSANGHALTLNKPLRALEINIFENVKKAWSVNGTPTDCVKLAIGAVLEDDEKPDLIVSGINYGQNMGTDIVYSGTVAAAMEGTILGYQAVSVSLAINITNGIGEEYFQTAADYVLDFVKNFENKKMPPKTLMNVNVPAIPKEDVKGVKVTKLGAHRFIDVFEKRADLRSRDYYWLAGQYPDYKDEPDTDVAVLKDHYISLTPIHYDLTMYDFLDGINNWDILNK